MQTTNLAKLESEIKMYKDLIVNHPLYQNIHTVDDLKIFMEHHIFAVWDFMSLLKVLQRNLTCVEVPWFPVGNADTRYLINEIVTGEESDIDHLGHRKSHYELYLEAMDQCHANTDAMYNLERMLRSGISLETALEMTNLPQAAKDFMGSTFAVINEGKVFKQSAVFTFSREDLIPDMFISIIRDLDAQFPESISIFRYYLERHIEVDGDHHSHLALEMTSKLCGEDPIRWRESTEAVKESLNQRIKLWNSALEAIKANKRIRG